MAPETLMTRIKKLLALSSSPNQAEAEAAMAKAMDLMTRHGLDQATIDQHAREQEDPFTKDDSLVLPRMTIDDRLISHLLESYFRVRLVWVKSRNPLTFKTEYRMTFVGRVSDVEIAQYVHAFLRETFAQLFKGYCKSRGLRMNQAGLRESYYRGLAKGLNAKLASEQARVHAEAPSAQQAGLILADDAKRLHQALMGYFPRTQQSKRRVGQLDAGAYQGGEAAASGISLRQGVGAGRGPLQLT